MDVGTGPSADVGISTVSVSGSPLSLAHDSSRMLFLAVWLCVICQLLGILCSHHTRFAAGVPGKFCASEKRKKLV